MIKTSASITIQYESVFSPFPPAQFSQALEWVKNCGFSGVELIVCDPQLIDPENIFAQVKKHSLEVSAIATGQAAGIEGLSMTSPSRYIREATRQRLFEDIDFAVRLGNPKLPKLTIGSLRGKGGALSKHDELEFLKYELQIAADYAGKRGITINLEPINRYETSLLNSTASVYEFLESIGSPRNIGILYDTFHSAAEDKDMAESIRLYGKKITHVHFADSNRRLPGDGHIDFQSIVSALREVDYTGYVSLETLCEPSAKHIIDNAAEQMERITV